MIYDDDHYHMGGVLAELLVGAGRLVTLVTPQACVSSWTTNTIEQHRIQRRLVELGVQIVASHAVVGAGVDAVRLACVFTGRERELATGAAVFVTARLPQDAVYRELLHERERWADAGLETVRTVGDCLAPGTIAAAVWEGHRYAEELDEPDDRGATVPFRREATGLADEPGRRS